MGATHSLRSAIAFTAILIAAASHAKGVAVEAKSAELGDVKSAIATAREGDTVTVPAGTASWTSELVIKGSITLQGATSISGNLNSPVVTDKTIILDDVPRQGHRQQPGRQQQRSAAAARGIFSRRNVFARPDASGF